MSKKFDNKIKELLNQTEVSPSPDVWAGITSKLNQEKTKAPVVVPLFAASWFRYAIAASIAFVLGAFSVYTILQPKINKLASDPAIEAIETSNPDEAPVVQDDAEAIYQANNSEKNIPNVNQINTPVNATIASDNEATSNENGTKKSNSSNNMLTNSSGNSTSKSALALAAEAYYASNRNAGKAEIESYEARQAKDEDFLAYSSGREPLVLDIAAIYGNEIADYVPIQSYSLSIINTDVPAAYEIKRVADLNPISKDMKKKSAVGYNGFWIGPSVGFQSLSISKVFMAGGNVGLDLGYDFNNRFGVYTGPSLSFNGLEYDIELGTPDNPLTETIRRDYSALNIPFAFRYKFTYVSGKKGVPKSLNLVNGLEFAYNYGSNFSALGLRTGVEYDLFIQGATTLTFGAKAAILKNIGYNPSVFLGNTPYSSNFAAYISMRFIGPKMQQYNPE